MSHEISNTIVLPAIVFRFPKGLAFLSGAISALSFAPHELPIFAILGIALMFILFHWAKTIGLSAKQFFVLGWCFGLTHFALGLYWVGNALLVDFNRFYWLWPFAAIGIPALLAVYMGLLGAVYKLFPLRLFHSIGLFATLWTLIEIGRAYLFTGFPWNLLGSIWHGHLQILQLLAYVGPYGLSWCTAFLSGIIAALFLVNKRAAQVKYLILFVGLFGVVYLAGDYRLRSNEVAFSDVNIVVVQPNLQQKHKWKRDYFVPRFERILTQLKDANISAEKTIVAWPETAIISYLHYDPLMRKKIASVINEGSIVLVGALHKRFANGEWQRWNSVFAINAQGQIEARYDKHHLVPFGEYIPLKRYLGFVPLVATGSQFLPGPGPRVYNIQDLPSFSPQICYEVIFSGNMFPEDMRPEWILNVTNDAWFGLSDGPFQHFQSARFRAIEEGLPLVRSANTGVSALIDPYGRVVDSLPLNVDGVLITKLPQGIQEPTFYSRYKVFFILLFFFIFSIYIVSYYKCKH